MRKMHKLRMYDDGLILNNVSNWYYTCERQEKYLEEGGSPH